MLIQRLFAVFMVTTLLGMTEAYCQKATDGTDDPAFREVLVGETYSQRLREALERLPTVQGLEASKMPVSGAHVTGINPGHQAEGLNIQIDDVIVSIDGHLCWARWVDWQRSNQPQSLRIVTKDGKDRVMQIAPGLVGVQHINYRRPELAYIRRPDRNKDLDELVLVGLMMRSTDPDLAETAWHHAIGAGYVPDDLSDACLAIIANQQGRFDIAVEAAMRVPAVDAEHPYRLYPDEIIKIALPLGRFDLLLDMDPQMREQVGIDSRRFETLVNVLKNNATSPPSPVASAEKMNKIDLMNSAFVIEDLALNTGRDDHGLLTDDSADISMPQGEYTSCYLGFRKPSNNIDLTIRFSMTAPPQQTKLSNIFEVKLLDRDYRRRHGINMDKMSALELRRRSTNLGFDVACDEKGLTQYCVYFGNKSTGHWYEKPDIDLAQPVDFEVRITKLDDFADLQVNGKTIALTPVLEPTEQHGLIFWIVGSHVQIHELKVYGLEAKENTRIDAGIYSLDSRVSSTTRIPTTRSP